MGITYNTKTVTDDLVLLFDAANPKCLPGGNVIKNLVNNTNFTVAGAPTVGVTYGGSLTTDGVDDYFEISVPTTTERTVTVAFQWKTFNGYGPLWRINDWRERIFGGDVTLINSAVTYWSIGSHTNAVNTVQVISYSYNGTNAKGYTNGELMNSITMDVPMNTGTYTYRFGNQSSGSTNSYVNVEYFYIAFHDRQLSDDEVKSVHTAIRGRFGL
jgi:hypothetical protein